jgi:hypothetical protein
MLYVFKCCQGLELEFAVERSFDLGYREATVRWCNILDHLFVYEDSSCTQSEEKRRPKG